MGGSPEALESRIPELASAGGVQNSTAETGWRSCLHEPRVPADRAGWGSVSQLGHHPLILSHGCELAQSSRDDVYSKCRRPIGDWIEKRLLHDLSGVGRAGIGLRLILGDARAGRKQDGPRGSHGQGDTRTKPMSDRSVPARRWTLCGHRRFRLGDECGLERIRLAIETCHGESSFSLKRAFTSDAA